MSKIPEDRDQEEALVPIQFMVPKNIRRQAKALLATEGKSWADLFVPHIEDFLGTETQK